MNAEEKKRWEKLRRQVGAAIRNNRRFPMAGDAGAVAQIMDAFKEYEQWQPQTKQ